MLQFKLPPEDTKEYTPRKHRGDTSGRFSDNYNVSPEASSNLTAPHKTDDAVAAIDSGVMMSVSEILDFSSGADSETGKNS